MFGTVVLLAACCLRSLVSGDVEKMGRLDRSMWETVGMPINSNEEVRGVRFVERRRHGSGGITQGQFYNVTERWVRGFFEDPERHLRDLLGMDVSCVTAGSCVAAAQKLLEQHREEWRGSSERGKILVGLTYVLGQSILLQRSELVWTVVEEDGFVDDIGLSKGNEWLGIFGKLGSLKTFVLDEDGIDLLLWERILTSQNLSEIDPKIPTIDVFIKEEK